MIFAEGKYGVRFEWVGFDNYYGNNPALFRKLTENDNELMADIHSDHRINYENPSPAVSPP
jgi:hypothetical protein